MRNPSPVQFQELIGRPEPTLIHFFHGNPSPELGTLLSGGPRQVNKITYFVDNPAIDVGRDPSQLPLTVLYRHGEEVNCADFGDMDKFFELCERAMEY